MGTQLQQAVRHIRQLAGGRDEDLSDGQLLERFLGTGEEAAFAALVRRHGPMVLGVCRRVLANGADAEDAFQATFLVLLRRARSLDRSGPLAGWLHTVAYHVALKARADAARRRRKEGQVQDMPRPQADAEHVWLDVQPILDEELNRLPDESRAAVVLCYLEGKTNAEAARLLGWPVGTVKSRLARARELLRGRLTRRGITLSAGLLAPLLTERATAAVPGALIQATVRTALLPTGTAAAAVALAEGALQTMFVARLKIGAALLLTFGLVVLGVGASTPQAEAQRQTQTAPRLAPRPSEVAGKVKLPPAEPTTPTPQTKELTTSGRVLGADGKGLAGARVAAVVWSSARGAPPPKVLGTAKTDRDGKFRLTVPRPPPAQLQEFATLATAPGYAVGWHYPLVAKGVDIRLRPEAVLKGRLIDLQGQPAAGVKVHVTRLGTKALANGTEYLCITDGGEDDDEFDAPPVRLQLPVDHYALRSYETATALVVRGMSRLDRSKSMEATAAAGGPLVFPRVPEQLPGWPPSVTTDLQGRFTIRGIGRGQAVGLQVRDDRFALQLIDVPPQDKEQGEESTHVLAPARVLEGVVTDADTGKPIPHARLKVSPPNRTASDFVERLIGDGADIRGRRGMGGEGVRELAFLELMDASRGRPEELPLLETRADAKGRFRFNLFRAGAYTLRVAAAAGAPYLQRRARLTWPTEAVVRKQFDLTLQRGVQIKGKVTEMPGGKAVAEARVDFWSKGLKLPEGVRHPRPALTGADGTFQALLPPGAWHLLVNAPRPLYVPTRIAIDKLTDEQGAAAGIEDLLVVQEGKAGQQTPAPIRSFAPDAHLALDLKPGAAAREVALTLRRAPLLRGRVVGPDGKALTKVWLVRRPTLPFETAVFDATLARQLSLDRTGRDIVVAHWRKLGVYHGLPDARPTPIELPEGTFAIPVLDPAAIYRLQLLDPANKLGAVAELTGKQAGKEEVTVRLAPCGEARAVFVDGQGKPLVDYRPQLALLLAGPPAGQLQGAPPHAAQVRAADLDPARYGKGPRTDAEGRVTFGGLIPGASYRVLLGSGKATDFTALAGTTIELPRPTVVPPAAKAKRTEVAPPK